jgi:hypothetical protein
MTFNQTNILQVTHVRSTNHELYFPMPSRICSIVVHVPNEQSRARMGSDVASYLVVNVR